LNEREKEYALVDAKLEELEDLQNELMHENDRLKDLLNKAKDDSDKQILRESKVRLELYILLIR